MTRKRDTTPAQRTRAVAYIRVSTDKQATRGLSLEAQEERIRSYAALYCLELVEIVVESLSAKTLERPELQRALAMLESGQADALLVVKLDRLVRRVRDLGELIERWFAPGKAALLSVSEQIDTRSAAGRLVLNVLASVAQWEREAIGERTSAVLQYKASQGEFTGGRPPYGFRVDLARVVVDPKTKEERHPYLEPDPEEQGLVEAARGLRARGLSLREVSSTLATHGLVGRTGRPLYPQQVRRMLEQRESA
jgi:DNA invertase Pin-like site-specific DNA recombinase